MVIGLFLESHNSVHTHTNPFTEMENTDSAARKSARPPELGHCSRPAAELGHHSQELTLLLQTEPGHHGQELGVKDAHGRTTADSGVRRQH